MKKILSLLLAGFYFSLVYSQVDREFWFAAPEVSSQHADKPVYLHISTFSSAARVAIRQPANPLAREIVIQIPANKSESIVLNDFYPLEDIENIESNTVTNKGILISSDEKISAYYEVRGSLGQDVVNTDLFTLKGRSALGTKFFTPFQSDLMNYEYSRDPKCWSSIDIVATEDRTTIKVIPKVDVLGSLANDTIFIELNKGQTYSVRGLDGTLDYHMSGTSIISNKNIAVTVKDDSVILPVGRSWDLVGDQLVPVDVLGLEYLVGKGKNYIVVTQDSTTIEYSHRSTEFFTKTLNAGDHFKIEDPSSLEGVDYIRSDKPIYLFALKSIGEEFSGAIVPRISCSGSKKINFTRATEEDFKLELFFKTGSENDFKLNGRSLDLDSFDSNIIMSTGGIWSYAYRTFSLEEIGTKGSISIENEKAAFHLGVLNGSTITGAQYGFFSSFDKFEIGKDQSFCQGDSLVLDAGLGRESYLWSDGSAERFFTVYESGTYTIRITEGSCEASDTIVVSVFPSIVADLGGDKGVCTDVDTLLVASRASTYLWSTGDTTRSTPVAGAGIYSVFVTNEYKCSDSDSIFIERIDTPSVTQPSLITICDKSVYEINFKNEDAVYEWYQDDLRLPEVEGSISLSEEATYKVVSFNQCGRDSSSFDLEFWDIEIPNIITPNHDGKNDVLMISGIEKGIWDFRVINRWGDQVYRNLDFSSEWEPKVVDGTYFYYLKNEEFCNEFKGWIQILR